MPLIPGRRTSNMRHSALRGWSEFKNSSAEANTLTSRLTDLISRSNDLRTGISSLIYEITSAISSPLYYNRRMEQDLLHLSGGSTGLRVVAGSPLRTEGRSLEIVDFTFGETTDVSESSDSPPSSPDRAENQRPFCA